MTPVPLRNSCQRSTLKQPIIPRLHAAVDYATAAAIAGAPRILPLVPRILRLAARRAPPNVRLGLTAATFVVSALAHWNKSNARA